MKHVAADTSSHALCALAVDAFLFTAESLTGSTSALAAAVTPAVPTTTIALTFAARPDEGLVLSHVVMSGTDAVAADLTAACVLTPHPTLNSNDEAQEANGN